MGQYARPVFVCPGGETCPTQGDVEGFVKVLRAGVVAVGKHAEVKHAEVGINKAGCFSQCGHGPMMVVSPENVWYCGVRESDLREILESHVLAGVPVRRLIYDPGAPGPNKVAGVP
jgi:(2Fe-2S) ferredoxin